MSIEALRTDDSRFESLPDWPYRPKYVDDLAGYEGLRMHFVDEGPADAPVFLCLHGEPTWAYLYRRMMPVFLDRGMRVVAPDFFGFGRSDKPVDDAVYTWDFHRNSLLRFIEALDLTDMTLVVQDWGGLLGLTIPVDMAERVSGLLIMNTGLGVGVAPSEGFVAWRDYVARTPDLAVGKLIARGTPHLTEAEIAAYDAPFPGPDHKAGVRRFPAIVPTDPSMAGVDTSKAAARWWSEDFDGHSFMAIGLADPVLGGPVMHRLRNLIRGCPEPLEVPEGGHFLQEWGAGIAEAALDTWGM
ncbi:MAG: haloalkane dehalogenase [Acidimicrobiia bacterium]|nr:haloalkane dehalogenase [Acidimicrobiia bacterium]MDH4309504.1 haloalkane dehalogenase [Acidimicrobiia bacterium]